MRNASQRLDYIDGLRGLAILMVMACHYLPNAADYTFTSELGIAKMIMLYAPNMAWTGVDLFFVISGFLIGGILMRNRDADNFFRVFYIRRFGRILPVYSIWLAILVAGVTGSVTLYSMFADHFPLLVHFTFTQNLAAASMGEFGSIWEIVTWSLAVEEQFYLVLPLMIWLLPQRYLIPACIVGIVAAPLVRIALFATLDHPEMYAYTLFPARMDSLFLGVAIAAALRDEALHGWLMRRVPVLRVAFWGLGAGMAILLLSNWNKTDYRMATIGYSEIALFYASVVTLAALGRLPGQEMLRLLPLRLAGYWCFSLYLFHVPIHYLVWEVWERNLGRPSNAENMLVIILSVALSMAVSAALMRLVEGPMIRLAGTLKYHHPTAHAPAVAVQSLEPTSPVDALPARSPA